MIGEDALLHLAGVFGAKDDHFLVFEAQVDAGLRGHARGQPVGGELAGVVDHEVGRAEVRQFRLRGPDQHGVHEQGMVGARRR